MRRTKILLLAGTVLPAFAMAAPSFVSPVRAAPVAVEAPIVVAQSDDDKQQRREEKQQRRDERQQQKEEKQQQRQEKQERQQEKQQRREDKAAPSPSPSPSQPSSGQPNRTPAAGGSSGADAQTDKERKREERRQKADDNRGASPDRSNSGNNAGSGSNAGSGAGSNAGAGSDGRAKATDGDRDRLREMREERRRDREDKKSGNDANAKPSDAKPADSKASDSKASDSKSGNDKSSNDKAQDSKGSDRKKPDDTTKDDRSNRLEKLREDRREKREDAQERREDRQERREDRREEKRVDELKDRIRDQRRENDRLEDRIDRLKDQRKETRDGDRVIITEPGGRRIIREGDRVIIRRDETARIRFGVDPRNIREERRNGEIRTVVTRPDGSRVITVTDEDGRLIRRVREHGGREYVLIDNRRRPDGLFVALNLAPPVITIPRERYVVDADVASEGDIEEAFTAPPVQRLERSYSLDEVRQSAPLRQYVRSVDLDAITFDTGSWYVKDDQIPKLEKVGEAMEDAIKKNPQTVFMIEGHTDAVGSDEDNLSLSDRRAESVAEVLTKYFDIPAENLVTQGYGEQYLKVDTPNAEERNRRVTVRNITPLLTSEK